MQTHVPPLEWFQAAFGVFDNCSPRAGMHEYCVSWGWQKCHEIVLEGATLFTWEMSRCYGLAWICFIQHPLTALWWKVHKFDWLMSFRGIASSIFALESTWRCIWTVFFRRIERAVQLWLCVFLFPHIFAFLSTDTLAMAATASPVCTAF